MWPPLDGRVVFAVPVTVTGTTSDGKSFSESLYTIDVGRYGVRLDRAYMLRRPGEHVILQYGNRSARYRVAWIGAASSLQKGQAGLALLEGEPYLWGSDPARHLADPASPTETIDTPAPAESAPARPETPPASQVEPAPNRHPQQERRSTPRYLCDRGVLCWREKERTPLWGKLHNLSLGGCFILTRQTFNVGEAVTVVMVLYGTRIRARAEVRVQRPGAGMGLRFVSMAPEDLHSLQTALQRLSIPSSRPAYSKDSQAVVLRQLQSWFQHNPILHREQFYRLLRRTHPEK